MRQPQRILYDNDTLLLSQQAFEAFSEHIENSPASTYALRQLMARLRSDGHELLAAHHKRANFDCGEQLLKLFLQQHAGQKKRRVPGQTHTVEPWKAACILLKKLQTQPNLSRAVKIL
jgi:hypothetical protein